MAYVLLRAGQPPAWFLVFFPVFFVGGWLLVMFTISRFSGWSDLADYYRNQQPFMGTMIRNQGAQLRFGSNYNGCLNFGAAAEGLYLVPMILFRAFHPALLIPWNEITATPIKLWFFFNFVELRSQRMSSVPIRIRESLAKRLSEESAGRFSYKGQMTPQKF